MPIYFYWGEDDFAIEKAVSLVRDRVLDPQWISFNYTSFSSDVSNALIQALNQVMTPPFGSGARLVWLVNTTLSQHCSEDVLVELQRTLPVIPDNSFLLLTSSHKPDERLKSTKILKKFAEIREFSLISPWKTELLLQSVNRSRTNCWREIDSRSADMLVEAVGNDTRLLYNELEKLHIYSQSSNQPLDEDTVSLLVRNTTQNSLQLAVAMRTGDTVKALAILADLLTACEPGLRIVATLIGQFRTWLWVKIMLESGERNQQAIAQVAEIGNPNRIYYLQKDVQSLSVQQLIACLPLLLELEVGLKQGVSEMSILQTKVVEICQVCQKGRA